MTSCVESSRLDGCVIPLEAMCIMPLLLALGQDVCLMGVQARPEAVGNVW